MCEMTHSYAWHNRSRMERSHSCWYEPHPSGDFSHVSTVLRPGSTDWRLNKKIHLLGPRSILPQECEFFILGWTDSHLWHDSFICVTWLDYMCNMTYSYVRHGSFTCVRWLIHMRDMTHTYVWLDLPICVTFLIYIFDVTHSNVWHYPFIYVTWLIHMCDTTHSYVWHDSFICVAWLIHMG